MVKVCRSSVKPHPKKTREYFRDVASVYMKYWVWHEGHKDLPKSVKRIYWYIRNDNMTSYAGLTSNEMKTRVGDVRIQKGCVFDHLRWHFYVIVFGYLDSVKILADGHDKKFHEEYFFANFPTFFGTIGKKSGKTFFRK